LKQREEFVEIEKWLENGTKIETQVRWDVRSRKMMTCCHYVIFRTYFDHFDRVMRQYEVSRGVKSKKFGRTKSFKSWRDLLSRETIFSWQKACF
jgi:hypothetical protein